MKAFAWLLLTAIIGLFVALIFWWVFYHCMSALFKVILLFIALFLLFCI